MASSLQGKKAVVLSDNDLLCRAIEMSLRKRFQMEVLAPPVGSIPWPTVGDGGNALALIIVALSAPTGEPLLALVRASLANQIGQVPILIISDRPFDSRPAERILHLDFPFRPDELHDRVKGLLAPVS